jgi:hypothetical protein
VARIEADADPRRAAQAIEDGGELFESMSKVRPLPRGVLQQHHRLPLRTLRKQAADRVSDEPQARRLGA